MANQNKNPPVTYFSFSADAPDIFAMAEIRQAITMTVGDFYYLAYTTSGRTAGSVTASVGGTVGTARNTNATFNETFQAGSNGLLVFTATADFDGSLDNVSLKRVTPLDDLVDSLDSSIYAGGAVNFAAFDENHKMGFFSGTAMNATIRTGEREMTPNRATHLNGFKVNVDGGTVTAKVGTREAQSDTVVFGASQTPNTRDRVSFRKKARYHTFEMGITGDFVNAAGFDFDDSRDIKPSHIR